MPSYYHGSDGAPVLSWDPRRLAFSSRWLLMMATSTPWETKAATRLLAMSPVSRQRTPRYKTSNAVSRPLILLASFPRSIQDWATSLNARFACAAAAEGR